MTLEQALQDLFLAGYWTGQREPEATLNNVIIEHFVVYDRARYEVLRALEEGK